jgi:hypothetical protein
MLCSQLLPFRRMPASSTHASRVVLGKQNLPAPRRGSGKASRQLRHCVYARKSAAEEGSIRSVDAAQPAASAANTASETLQRPRDIDPTLCNEVSDPTQPQPPASAGAEEPTATSVNLSSGSSGNGSGDFAAADGNGADAKDDLGAKLWAEAQEGQQIRDDYEAKAAPPKRWGLGCLRNGTSVPVASRTEVSFALGTHASCCSKDSCMRVRMLAGGRRSGRAQGFWIPWRMWRPARMRSCHRPATTATAHRWPRWPRWSRPAATTTQPPGRPLTGTNLQNRWRPPPVPSSCGSPSQGGTRPTRL